MKDFHGSHRLTVDVKPQTLKEVDKQANEVNPTPPSTHRTESEGDLEDILLMDMRDRIESIAILKDS